MKVVLTGFGISHNLREGHRGHVFMSRFKSILVERETYLLEVIRYIHLNPVRAGLARNLEELERFQWSGHYELVTGKCSSWFRAEAVLQLFGDTAGGNLKGYIDHLRHGLQMERNSDITNGNYIVGRMGMESSSVPRDALEGCSYTGAILGSPEFAAEVADSLRSELHPVRERRMEHSAIGWLIESICRDCGITPEALKGRSRKGQISLARKAVTDVLLRYGITEADIGRLLGIARSSVSSIANNCQNGGNLLANKYMEVFSNKMNSDP